MTRMQEIILDKIEEVATDAGFEVGYNYNFSNDGHVHIMTPALETVISVGFSFQFKYAELSFQEPGREKHEARALYDVPADSPASVPSIMETWGGWVARLQEKHGVRGDADPCGPVAEIIVEMDNAAFDDNAGRELAAILDNLAAEVFHYPHWGNGFRRTLQDTNGNTVGELTVSV